MEKNKFGIFENGITLIALLISIIILIILSSIAIRAIVGDESIFKSTETAADKYNIESYKEQIKQKIIGVVALNSAMGKEVDEEELAKEIKNETTWVKNVEVTTNNEIANKDILVTTVDGYTFQVYYNGNYGVNYIEYIGRAKTVFPNIKASYEKNITSIIAKVSIEKGDIEKLELIYKGEVIQTVTDLSQEIRIDINESGTGWYTIKVTSDKGALRYAWVKATTISDKLTIPKITVTPEVANGENDWYVTTPKIKIETDSISAKDIYYTLSTDQEERHIYNGEFDITTVGAVIITAWTEDGEGYQSEEVSIMLKFDNIKPEIIKVEVEADVGENGWIVSNRSCKNCRCNRPRKSD